MPERADAGLLRGKPATNRWRLSGPTSPLPQFELCRLSVESAVYEGQVESRNPGEHALLGV